MLFDGASRGAAARLVALLRDERHGLERIVEVRRAERRDLRIDIVQIVRARTGLGALALGRPRLLAGRLGVVLLGEARELGLLLRLLGGLLCPLIGAALALGALLPLGRLLSLGGCLLLRSLAVGRLLLPSAAGHRLGVHCHVSSPAARAQGDALLGAMIARQSQSTAFLDRADLMGRIRRSALEGACES